MWAKGNLFFLIIEAEERPDRGWQLHFLLLVQNIDALQLNVFFT